ncbi:MAG: hypothetical protein ACOYMA_20885 [Bacteroidia bacterium]
MKKLLTLVILLINLSAFSCTCRYVNLKNGYDYSSAIFYGKYIGTNTSTNFNNLTGSPFIVDNFEVSYFIKGVDSSTFNFVKRYLKNQKYIVSIISSKDEPCGLTFDMNKMYLVYTYNDFSTFLPTTSGCTRTRVISNNNFILIDDFDDEYGKDELIELIKIRDLDSNYTTMEDYRFNIITETKILKKQLKEADEKLNMMTKILISFVIFSMVLLIIFYLKNNN